MISAFRITLATVVAAALLPAAASAGSAPAERKDGYWTDTQGGIVRSLGAGVCVRSSQWTPALAVAECDPDLVKKPAPPAKPAAKPAAKPKPEAKPKPKPAAKPKPAKPVMMNIEEKIELQGMPFDKAEMTAENKEELDKFLGSLMKATKARSAVNIGALIITGHTDRLGSLRYNTALSERRATVVKDYVVSKGVDPKVIFWEGKAFKQPIPVTKFCDNKMNRKQLIECLAPNRRVTVELVGQAVNLKPKPKPKAEAKPEAKPKPKAKP